MKNSNVEFGEKQKIFSISSKIILIFSILILVFSGITVGLIGKTLNANSLKRFNRIVPRDLVHISNSFRLFFI